jgi:hypothetical protein
MALSSTLYPQGSLMNQNLKDLYKDLTGGAIPCVRKVTVLEVA